MKSKFSCVINAWRHHESELRRYLAHRIGAPHLAEDLLQDTFVKAMHQGERFCRLDNPRAWLFQVARNTLIDHHRLHHETVELPEELPESKDSVEPIDELGACVVRVLAELSIEDSDIIQQCDLQGVKQQDYALMHGLSLAAVKSRLLRARQRMRNTMSKKCQVSFDEDGRVQGYVPRC